MIKPYSVFLHLEVTDSLQALKRSEREQILLFIRSLARDPFQSGDFQQSDESGRVNEAKLVGRFAVFFYTDNADAEVRIVQIRQV